MGLFAMLKKLLLIQLILLPSLAIGADSENNSLEDDGGWALYIDQDLFALDTLTGLNDDRDYTMGLEFAYFGKRTTRWPIFSQLHSANKFISRNLRLDSSDVGSKNFSAHIGGTAFTPENYGPRAPEPLDRPFASLLYLSANNTWIADNEQEVITNRLNVGLLGTDIGYVVQYEIHHWQSGTAPRGWDNQHANDHPEPTFLLHHGRRYLHYDDPEKSGPLGDIELSYGWDVNAGWYVNAGASALLRWGKTHSKFYQHISNPMKSANQLRAEDSTDHYFFAEADWRAVGYNQLLQGAWFSNGPVEYGPNDLRRFVQTYTAGFTTTLGRCSLTYAFHYSTSDVKSRKPQADRDHAWGGIYLTFYNQ